MTTNSNIQLDIGTEENTLNNTMKEPQKKPFLLPIFAGITTAVIWGISFLFTKDALKYTFPMQLLGLRFASGAVAITVLTLFRLIKVNFSGKDLRGLILLAFFQPFLYFIGETWGVKWTSASEAGMIIGLVPVVTALMAAVFLHERISLMQGVFVVCSVIGVFVVVQAQGRLAIGQHFWGILALILAVLSTSAYSIMSKKSSAQFTPVEITFVMMWVGAIVFNLIGIAQGSNQDMLNNYLNPLTHSSVITAVLYLGVLSSVGGFFLFNYALSHITVAQSAPLINLTTVVSVLGGVLIQGDPFSLVQFAGIALIIAGVWGTNAFVKR